MISSSSACSAKSSTSLSVETRCCASTSRQTLPSSATRSERRAPGVEIGDGMDEARHRLDLLDRTAVKRAVAVPEPGARNLFIAAGDRIERAEEANEEGRELEGLGAALERELAFPHPRHRRLRHPDDAGERLRRDVEPTGGAQCG